MSQVLVSPLVAGLVVSIGVPILLFYIYGVVPVSLCRSGGCDVSTSGSGFHFDFDDYSEDEGEGEEEEGRGRRVTELGARLGYRGGNIAGEWFSRVNSILKYLLEIIVEGPVVS